MAMLAGTWMKGIEAADGVSPETRDPAIEVQHLFDLYGAALFRFARSLVANDADAEDIVQDTFLKLQRHLHPGGDRSNLRAWIFAVAANACRDRARWRLRWLPWRAELDTRSVEAEDEAPDRRRARAAFAALAQRDRLLLSLRAQGLSYREIAAAAGIAEASVGKLLARAVAHWKQRLHS